MIKRRSRRNLKTNLVRVISLAAMCIVVVGVFFGVKQLLPLTKFLTSSSGDDLVKGVGATTTIPDLKEKLDKKNIIFDRFYISSTSGILVGVVRDGPTVYFSFSEPAAWQVDSLLLIMSRTSVNNKKPSFIDLRRARPIVKF